MLTITPPRPSALHEWCQWVIAGPTRPLAASSWRDDRHGAIVYENSAADFQPIGLAAVAADF